MQRIKNPVDIVLALSPVPDLDAQFLGRVAESRVDQWSNACGHGPCVVVVVISVTLVVLTPVAFPSSLNKGACQRHYIAT